jgi:hypothetical protein
MMCYITSEILPSSVPKTQISNAIFLKFDLFSSSHSTVQRLGHEINHHHRLAQRLKMDGAIPLLPLYDCMECTGKTVPFDFPSLNIQNTGKDHMLACIHITTYMSRNNVNKHGNQ